MSTNHAPLRGIVFSVAALGLAVGAIFIAAWLSTVAWPGSVTERAQVIAPWWALALVCELRVDLSRAADER